MLEQIKARLGQDEEIIATVQPDEKGYRSSSNLKVMFMAIVPAIMIWLFFGQVTNMHIEGMPEGMVSFTMRFSMRIILFAIMFGAVLLIIVLVNGNLGRGKAKQIYYVFTNQGVFFNPEGELRYLSYSEVQQFILRTHKSGNCSDMLIFEKEQMVKPITLQAVPNASELLAKLEPYLGSAAYGMEELLTNFEYEDGTGERRTTRRRRSR